jgi:small subunit ribosomal protein S20
MAHSKQAKKRVRQNEKRRQANRVVASRMRSELRKVIRAAENGDAETVLSTYALAMKHIDKAAKVNLVHKNAAARQKSRITAAVRKVQAGATSQG